MLRAEILVLGSIFEHVVDGDQEGAGDGDDGSLFPSPRGQPAVEGAEIAVRFPGDAPGGFHQAGPQPGIALSRPARAPFPGRLVVAGADLGPGGYVAVA